MRSSNVTSTAAVAAPAPGTVRYGLQPAQVPDAGAVRYGLQPQGPDTGTVRYGLQPVQGPDAGYAILPSSVARSADGEEGALEYNRRLHESNIHPSSVETRSDCQQVPPNRTVTSSWQDDVIDDLTHRLPLHSQSTSRTKSRTVDAVGLTPVRHPAPSRQTAKLLSGDYVSSSELTTWRSSLTRTSRMQAPPPETVEEAAATMAREKPRSGSADSVCRRLIKFTRRLISTSRTRKSPPLVSSRSGSDDGNDLISPTSHSKPEEEEFEEVGGASGGKGPPPEPKPSHWELPPNYVDMIFTRSLLDDKEGGGEKALVVSDKKYQQQLLKHRQKEQAKIEHSRAESNVRTSPKV